MTKQKLVLYSSVILLFCVVWITFIYANLRAVDISSRESIQQTMHTLHKQAQYNMELHAQNLLLLFESQTPIENPDEMQDSTGERILLTADRNGQIYGSQYPAVQSVLDRETLHTARQKGSTYVALKVSLENPYTFAVIVTDAATQEFYGIELLSTEQFFALSFLDYSADFDTLSLYTLNGEALHALAPDESPAQSKNMVEAALEYSQGDGNAIQHGNDRGSYIVFIEMPLLEGWFLGFTFRSLQAVSMYASILRTSLLALAAWLVLIALLIVLDVTANREKQREVRQASLADSLTGLLDQQGQETAVKHFFTVHSPSNYSFVMMDLVAFQRLYIMFGSTAGDTLLQIVGATLRSNYPCAARLSGDVFAFLAKTSPRLVQDAKTHLINAVQKELGQQYLPLMGYKFGVYPIKNVFCSYPEIYEGAMLALQAAKNSPERSGIVYNPLLQQNADTQCDIERNMHNALHRGEFATLIQPKFDVKTEKCCGGEALVRWKSPELGFLVPGDFIPLFEENGFIAEIDFYMLSSVLTIIGQELQQGLAVLPISVNQSRATLSAKHYLERIYRLVEKHPHVPLNLIELEITETALESGHEMRQIVQTLKAIGFAISIDDFGTGYSSLNTLRELSADTLKIDKEFLIENEHSGRSRKIIRSITRMSKDLGVKVVCEGVETQAQLRFLFDAGCEIAQGYFFSQPITVQQYESRFLSGSPTAKSALQ